MNSLIFNREVSLGSSKEAEQFGIRVVVVDIPRPPKMIDVGSDGHKPPGESNEDDPDLISAGLKGIYSSSPT